MGEPASALVPIGIPLPAVDPQWIHNELMRSFFLAVLLAVPAGSSVPAPAAEGTLDLDPVDKLSSSVAARPSERDSSLSRTRVLIWYSAG